MAEAVSGAFTPEVHSNLSQLDIKGEIAGRVLTRMAEGSADKTYAEQCAEFRTALTEHGLQYKIDESGASIGRRYARADELGIPFAVTFDVDTVGKGEKPALKDTVTLRERDSSGQVRVPLSEAASSWGAARRRDGRRRQSVRERRAPWSPGRGSSWRAPGPSAASVLRTCRGASSLAPLATPPEVEVLRRRRIFLPFQGSGGVCFGTFPVRHLLRLV